MMSKILNSSIVSAWINHCIRTEDTIPRSVLVKQNEECLQLLEKLGIFRRTGIGKIVACKKCERGHVEDVIKREQGKFGYYCLKNGWIDLSKDDVTQMSFDRNALLDTLTAVAGLRKTSRRSYADKCLVSLGLINNKVRRQPWSLGYADKLENQNVLTSIITALSGQFPDGPGLIISPSFININLPLPRKYKLVSLDEFIIGTKEGFIINNQTVDIRLGNRSKTPDKVGRRSQKEIVRQIWKDTHSNPEWPSKRKDQAKFIAAQWDVSVSLPALGTLENHIRVFEKEKQSSS